MTFSDQRYDKMIYRRCGRSGLKLPAISLGCWHNFGGDPQQNHKDMLFRAFDLGITHFDLANNYGPPPGSAETNVGRILKEDFGAHRDELIISSKAGYLMWPGPYGEWGSKKNLIASLDQSLKRLQLDYVDIFYSHRFDPETPLDETMDALDTAVRQGKALYAGISSYKSDKTRVAADLLRERGTSMLIHQPSYSMLNRGIEEDGLLDTTEELGMGMIVFCPLNQGLLTNRYLNGIPDGSRATMTEWMAKRLTPEFIAKLNQLNDLAADRGQSLAQMALTWVLRDDRVTSALMGASKVSQIEDNVAAFDAPPLSAEELAKIDRILGE